MTQAANHPVNHSDQHSEKLSVWTKLAYGSGDLGTAITAALRSFFLLFFLTDVARLSPITAGSILLINRVWDAFNDPLIGWLSDRTVTRWGRRRPWLIAGALPFGILFFMTWVVPPFGPRGLYIYYVVVALLLDTVYTIINVPYVALTPELTQDYDERTSLNSYRFAFSIGGGLVAAVLHPIIVNHFADVRTGYMVSGAVWSIVSTIPCFIVFFGTKERPESMQKTQDADSMGILEQIKVAFSNKPYRFVIAIYLFSWLALQLISAVLIYYLNYYIGAPDMLPMVLLAIQGTALVFLFIWSAVSRRLDKRYVYMIGASIWIVVQIALYFVQPGMRGVIIPLAAVAGAGASVAYLIPWAMMPDVIEFDELETGQRREGIFYGFMVFLQKTSIALGIFMVGRVLSSNGYITPTEAVPVPVQPDSALNAIRLFIGPIPAVILLIGLILTYFYPVTREKHGQIRARLAERREALDAAAAQKQDNIPATDD
ncbi:MAG: MFS transporter [Caldilineaceae bacterium]|nr:MFS transporter [Caldilineaceae bacterium]